MLGYLSSPFKWFFKLEAAGGLLLLISAIIALIVSNSNYSEIYFNILQEYIFVGFMRNCPKFFIFEFTLIL